MTKIRIGINKNIIVVARASSSQKRYGWAVSNDNSNKTAQMHLELKPVICHKCKASASIWAAAAVRNGSLS